MWMFWVGGLTNSDTCGLGDGVENGAKLRKYIMKYIMDDPFPQEVALKYNFNVPVNLNAQ